MKVEELKGCRRRVVVEVPAEAVDEAFRRATREWAREARVTGFRKGKAPAKLVRQRFGPEIEREVGDRLVGTWLAKALEEKDLKPIQNPLLESLDLKEGRPATFRALIDVLPEIKLGDYRGGRVTAKRAGVGEENVAEALESLRRRAAKLLPVTGRPARAGDFLVGTLASGPEGEERPAVLDLGDGDLFPEFREALPGTGIGAERPVTVTYPKEHADPALAGRRVEYRFRLREIKRRELPALDDAFARQVGSFQTLEELRVAVRKDLEEKAEREWQAAARHELLEQVLAAHDFEPPESLVEAELQSRVEDILRMVQLQEWEKEKAERLWSQEWKRQRPAAERGVRATLLLEAIAAAEGIEVPENEINDRLRREASRQRRTVSALKEEIARRGGWKSLKRTVLREKALDFLLENANISKEGFR